MLIPLLPVKLGASPFGTALHRTLSPAPATTLSHTSAIQAAPDSWRKSVSTAVPHLSGGTGAGVGALAGATLGALMPGKDEDGEERGMLSGALRGAAGGALAGGALGMLGRRAIIAPTVRAGITEHHAPTDSAFVAGHQHSEADLHRAIQMDPTKWGDTERAQATRLAGVHKVLHGSIAPEALPHLDAHSAGLNATQLYADAMRLNDKHQQAGSHNHNEMYHKINDLHAHVTKGTPGAEDILRDTHKRLTYVDAIHAHESGADHPVLAAHAAHVKAQAAAAAAPAPATPGPPPLPPAPPAPAPIPRVITAADFLQNHHNAAGVAKGDAFRFSTPAEAQAVIDHLVAGHGPAAIAAAASGAYTFGPANEWELKATPGGHVLTKVASLLGVIGPRVTYTLTRVKDAAKRPPLTTPKAPAALKHEVPPAPVVEAPVAPAKVDPVVPHVAVEAPPAQAEAPKAPKGPRKLPKLQAA